MSIRIALPGDIPAIQFVRNAVRENRLSDPAIVPDHDVEDYICRRGRGWVYETEVGILGFSIVSVTDYNVWALFVLPGYEGNGIGRILHDSMMNWYFSQTAETIWLSTGPQTRAETFYPRAGWERTGLTKSGEVKFEMTAARWKSLQPSGNELQ